jgi:hypothetical protein
MGGKSKVHKNIIASNKKTLLILDKNKIKH